MSVLLVHCRRHQKPVSTSWTIGDEGAAGAGVEWLYHAWEERNNNVHKDIIHAAKKKTWLYHYYESDTAVATRQQAVHKYLVTPT